jgi:hypothetical protein
MPTLGLVFVMAFIALMIDSNQARNEFGIVPKSKSRKGGLQGLFGKSIIRNMFREAKLSFCSELESLTLQVIIFSQ